MGTRTAPGRGVRSERPAVAWETEARWPVCELHMCLCVCARVCAANTTRPHLLALNTCLQGGRSVSVGRELLLSQHKCAWRWEVAALHTSSCLDSSPSLARSLEPSRPAALQAWSPPGLQPQTTAALVL